MGGIALGKGVSSSGLLDILGDNIEKFVSNLSLNSVVLVLTLIVLVSHPSSNFIRADTGMLNSRYQVISTFISHTIASVLLVPIANEVGKNLPGNHQRLLIFLTGLVCSTGMGMPVSGFPNQTAYVGIRIQISPPCCSFMKPNETIFSP